MKHQKPTRKWVLLLTLVIILELVTAKNISEGINGFTLDLLYNTAIIEEKSNRNIAISPFTVWNLLAVIDEGARGNTARQIEAVLGIPTDKQMLRKSFTDFTQNLLRPAQGVDLQLSAAIFTNSQQNLKEQFREVSRKYYGVHVEPVNFVNSQEAAKKINTYVANATKNRVTDFIGPDELIDAEIFLTTTLYFKGAWSYPFNRSETKKEMFFDENRKPLGQVDMMFQSSFFGFNRMDDVNATVVELPYGNNEKMSMVLMLPFEDQTTTQLLANLAKVGFEKVLQGLDLAKYMYEGDKVKVNIPRFSANSEYILNSVLHKMGLKDVFNSQTADLLGIFHHLLYISKLVQKAEIEVNEEGTVASAAAGAELDYKIIAPEFEANRPFLYFIVDNPTRSIVFAGKYCNPNEAKPENVKSKV